MSDGIKGQLIKVKRESMRNNQTLKEVACHVNKIYSRKDNGEAMKRNAEKASLSSISFVRNSKREKILKNEIRIN